MKKRVGYVKIIFEPALSRMKKKQCPSCGKPKSKWKRRKDWRCCSKICTEKFFDMYIAYGWQDFRLRVFQRDKFTCVKCKSKPGKKIIEYGLYDDADENYWRKIVKRENQIFKEFKTKKKWRSNPDRFSKYVCFQVYDLSTLIGDHIKPIALGGEEFDMENIQTLCILCDKKKTSKDLKLIAIQRKLAKEQIKLKKKTKSK